MQLFADPQHNDIPGQGLLKIMQCPSLSLQWTLVPLKKLWFEENQTPLGPTCHMQRTSGPRTTRSTVFSHLRAKLNG